MRTVVLEPLPSEVAALIERRRALGQDHLDEVWEGVYHMAPAPSKAHAYLDDELAAVLRRYGRPSGLVGSGPFNLGEPDDYRVPDRGLHRARSAGVWETTAMVVEIVSAGDETFEKFGFYAAHGVDEILVADPASRVLRLWRLAKATEARASTGYEETDASELLHVTAAELASAIDWPPAESADIDPGR